MHEFHSCRCERENVAEQLWSWCGLRKAWSGARHSVAGDIERRHEFGGEVEELAILADAVEDVAVT